tara:strand:- start:457 stop:801 length:345 start_codon:yes stop_codon:yes gene_type:complete
MIKISVDEGYAFDYLSILEIKSRKIKQNKTLSSFKECKKLINSQLSGELFSKIYNSNEYSACLKANQETFNAVERARYGKISSKEVDDLNMKRYAAKSNLQKKFFNNKLSESKT